MRSEEKLNSEAGIDAASGTSASDGPEVVQTMICRAPVYRVAR